VKAAYGFAAGMVRGLAPSPPVLGIAVIVVALAFFITVWLIMSRRYVLSYRTEKSHIELKPADPPKETHEPQ
jgi:membrane protein YdbS with pleckstrin-like domain